MPEDEALDDVTPAAAVRPVHLRPLYIGIVVLGGALGTGARELLALTIPAAGAFPTAIFVINLTGAFALGVALEILLRLGPDEGRRRHLRLLVGTGFLGGYTTYSTLAIGTAQAITTGHSAIGILYALLSVIGGAAAAFAGIAAAAAGHRTRVARREARR